MGFTSVLFTLIVTLFAVQNKHVVDYVNPFVGTANDANTFPGAVRPWGMVSVSPHNVSNSPSGYIKGKPFVYGFGHVHLSGTGCSDLGNVVLVPTTGAIQMNREKYRSTYDNEVAEPGYYRTDLSSYNITAEMTATCRSGISKYVFPECRGNANILIDASHRFNSLPARFGEVRVLSATEVEGFSLRESRDTSPRSES